MVHPAPGKVRNTTTVIAPDITAFSGYCSDIHSKKERRMGTFTLSPPAPARSFLRVLVCGYLERRRAGSGCFPTCYSGWKIKLKDECLHKIRGGF